MERKTFLSTCLLSGWAGAAVTPLADRGIPAPLAPRAKNPSALIMDAMGELRTNYQAPLVRQMLASGMDAITITLCDPKPVGAEALELAIDSMLEYDRFLAASPDLFLKATSVQHVDEARRSGRRSNASSWRRSGVTVGGSTLSESDSA